MAENEEPTPETAAEAEVLLPVPARRAPVPVLHVEPPPTRVSAALQRIRPALPMLARGAAAAVTLGAAGVIAAKSGPRLLRRVSELPSLPVGPSRPAPPAVAGDLLPSALPPPPDLVVVTREFVRWTRIEVYRSPAVRRPPP